MPREAILAVFATSTQAAEAAAAIQGAGFASARIRLFDAQNPDWGGQTTTAPAPDASFWAMLFGGGGSEPAAGETHEHGGTVLSVVADPGDAEEIGAIIDDLGPLEVERRAEGV